MGSSSGLSTREYLEDGEDNWLHYVAHFRLFVCRVEDSIVSFIFAFLDEVERGRYGVRMLHSWPTMIERTIRVATLDSSFDKYFVNLLHSMNDNHS